MQPLLQSTIILIGLSCGVVLAATPNFYDGFHGLPISVSLYHYKVPNKILQAQLLTEMQKSIQEASTKEAKAMKEGKHGTVSATVFVLPQLYVFDKAGNEIFSRTAESSDLDAQLDRVFSSPAPLQNGKPLHTWLGSLIPDEKSPIIEPDITGKFTVLEYWAPWCSYCFVERDQLLMYFKKRPNLHVNWITVDADITKITGTNPPSNG